jgi:hypothetical protein
VTLVRTGFIPIPPGKAPGFDHADVFRAGGRVYVAHTGADRIDMIDMIDERTISSFSGDRAAARVKSSAA